MLRIFVTVQQTEETDGYREMCCFIKIHSNHSDQCMLVETMNVWSVFPRISVTSLCCLCLLREYSSSCHHQTGGRIVATTNWKLWNSMETTVLGNTNHRPLLHHQHTRKHDMRMQASFSQPLHPLTVSNTHTKKHAYDSLPRHGHLNKDNSLHIFPIIYKNSFFYFRGCVLLLLFHHSVRSIGMLNEVSL